MHKRHQDLNIPVEIVRTVVAMSETGSLSKAGEGLGLSQPAVSSQIHRLQSLVGGALFSKMEPPPRSWVSSRSARREEFLKPTISYCGLAAMSRDPSRCGSD